MLEMSSETVKPMPATAPHAGQPRPADRQPLAAEHAAGRQPGCAGDAGGLADHVAHDDAERHRRAQRVAEQPGAQGDARVGQGEERHDHVARPRVQAVLQALVGRDGRAQRQLGTARELGRGLLAEGPEGLAGALEVAARRRVGARDEADGEPGDRRVDARLEHGDPDRGADHDRRGGAPDRREAQPDEHAEEPDRDGQRRERDVFAVDGGDDEQRAQVVDHRQGEQEDAKARRAARRGQRQQAEREGGVGRHRGAPAVCARAAGVEGQVDGDGRRPCRRAPPRPAAPRASVRAAPRGRARAWPPGRRRGRRTS